MSAGLYNILIEQGATWERSMQWKTESNVVIPLENMTAKMQVRSRNAEGTVVLELSTENGGITMNTTTDKIEMIATATQTGAIPEDIYVYDLEIYGTNNTVYRLLQGTVTLSVEVTHE